MPRMTLAILGLLGALGCSGTASRAPETDDLKPGEAAFEQGKYEDALKGYLDAAQHDESFQFTYRLEKDLAALTEAWEKEIAAYTTAAQCARFDRMISGYRDRCAALCRKAFPSARFDLLTDPYDRTLERQRYRIELAALEVHLEAAPDDASALGARAKLRLDLDAYKYCYEALQDVDRALAKNSGDPELHYVRGMAHRALMDRENGHTKEAEESFRRTVETLPDHAWAHYQLGQTLYIARRAKEALPCADRAITLLPGVPRFYEFRAAVKLSLLEKDHPEDLQSVLDDCRLWQDRIPRSEPDPDKRCEPLRTAAIARASIGDFKGAANELEAYLGRHPAPSLAMRLWLAQYLFAARDLKPLRLMLMKIATKAREVGERGVRVQALLLRSKVCTLLGDSDHATSDFNTARELDPRAPEPDWRALKAEYDKNHPKDPLAEAESARRQREWEERERRADESLRKSPPPEPSTRRTSACPVCDGKGQHWGSWSPSESYVDTRNGQTKTRSTGPTKVGWVTCETCKGSGALDR